MPSSGARWQLGRPNPRQRAFFLAGSRFVAYGGARGGGKSWAVRKKAVLLAAAHPGIRLLLLRRSYPELRENHILPLRAELSGIAQYHETRKALDFFNGSRLRFGYCDGDGDVLQYQGQEYDVIFIDEATQFTEYQYSTLTACLRGANRHPRRMYLTCNPGGVGHDWVKRLFVDRRFRGAERPEDYSFIPARVYDNEALLERDPHYLHMLQNLPEELRRAWLEGDWDVFAGQYFKEFSREVHVVAPYEIPGHWPVTVTMDYGLDMLACYWIASDEQGRAHVFRELYREGLIVSEAAEAILQRSAERVALYLAPPDLWSRRQESGRSVADLFAERGIPLTRTAGGRVAGWMALREWLRPTAGEEGRREARLRIFETCPNLIRTLPALRYDELRVNDAALHPHELTHAPDALRGFCVYWTPEARPLPKRPQPWAEDLLEDYANADAAGRQYLLEKYG
ncbi:MAG: hypothetical protein GXX99_01585 [Clostridiales bacterium]|nr:hypothetical protein [Clostridiales bacterium]